MHHVVVLKLAEILTILCAAAADLRAINATSKKSNWTALHAATFNGQLNAVRALVDKKADLTVEVSISLIQIFGGFTYFFQV